jgi:exopolysaccharide biosynthesis polyprenyl glycosylphosphotransferase
VGDSEQYLVGTRASSRAWSPRVRFPLVLAGLDVTAIAAVVAVATSGAIPLIYVSVFAGVLMALLAAGGVYSEKVSTDTPGKVPFTLAAITLAAMGVITLNFLILQLDVGPATVLSLWAGTVGAVATGRLIAWPVRTALLRSAAARKTLIIGSGIAATLLAEKIVSHPELGLETVGFIDDGPRRYVRGRREPLLGGLADLGDVIEATDAKVVIFAYTHNATPDMLSALYGAEPKVEVLMMPRYFEFVSTGMQVEGLAGMPLLRLNRPGLGRTERAFKRAEDVIVAGVASLVALPLVPLIALAIKVDSDGPVFYASRRVGQGGRIFPMYKFRSMTCNEDETENPNVAELGAAARRLAGARDSDPRLKSKAVWRVTRVGKFLRTTSLDELPQLWNVLRGDMSLVGPRPPLPDEVAAYEEWQKKRLAVSPGITGMWQVSGRSDLPFDEMVWLDFAYVDSWSLWLDFSILVQTVPAVLSRRGAY